MKPNRRKQYNVKENVVLKNIFNTGDIVCDIIDEQDIEGKSFYVIRSNNRVLKVAKEAYTIRKRG